MPSLAPRLLAGGRETEDEVAIRPQEWLGWPAGWVAPDAAVSPWVGGVRPVVG